MTETFYEVLGVPEDATVEEIEAAYRERLKETHPDVSDDEDAGQATQDLVEARDVLVDEDERAEYDRVGHAAYVGSSVADAAAGVAQSEGDSSAGGPQQTRDRSRRERTASRRVNRDRRRQTSESAETSAASDASSATDVGESAATASASNRTGGGGTKRRPPSGGTATSTSQSDGQGSTYSVRTEIPKSDSFGPILPSGQRLTVLAIFFALYPVMVFSALLPAFPLFVNLIIGGAAVLVVAYLQSMPRVALLVFGGWSAIALFAFALFGVSPFSVVGFAVFCGTVLPFGFSVLTAWALRY